MSHSRPFSAWLVVTTAILGGVLLTTSCREPKSPDLKALPTNVVVAVANQSITADAFQAELARHASPARAKQNEAAIKQAVLDEMVRTEVLYQRAIAAGYDKDPQISASLKRMIVAKFQEDQLARMGSPQVTAEELTGYYQRHPERFGTPEKVRAALIEIRVPRTATAEKRAEAATRAQAVLAEAKTNTSGDPAFGPLAQRYSEHQPSRYRGGDVGWFNAGITNSEWPQAVLAAMFKLSQPGELSPVIETPTAFYLVKLIEKQAARLRPLEEVKDGVAYLMAREKEQQRQEAMHAALRQGLNIQTNQALLEAISVPPRETLPPGMPGGPTVQTGNLSAQ